MTNILGHPIEGFSPGFKARVKARQTPPIEVSFADVTQEIGLADLNGERSNILLTDYDNDDDLDLYIPSVVLNATPNLFRNEGGEFVPAAQSDVAEMPPPLLISIRMATQISVCPETMGPIFLRNDGAGNFTEIAEITESTVAQSDQDSKNSKPILFVDYDHDGDLDLFTAGDRVEMHRNNADGVFSDVSDQTFIPPERPGARDAGIGDFDDDGDTDLLIVMTGVALHSTQTCAKERWRR